MYSNSFFTGIKYDGYKCLLHDRVLEHSLGKGIPDWCELESPSAVSPVFKICNAYESGFGHGIVNDNHTEGPYAESDLNEAYTLGYKEALALGSPKKTE